VIEIDAVGGRRENPNNKTNMTLNQLLVELDGFEQNTGNIITHNALLISRCGRHSSD
jgi:ATP-dependent Zn protease